MPRANFGRTVLSLMRFERGLVCFGSKDLSFKKTSNNYNHHHLWQAFTKQLHVRLGQWVAKVFNHRSYCHYTLSLFFCAVVCLKLSPLYAASGTQVIEEVSACTIAANTSLDYHKRTAYAHCLGWQDVDRGGICNGFYSPIEIKALDNDQIRIKADEVSLYAEGRSKLKGHVEVQQFQRVIQSHTAYIYRNSKTNQVDKIVLLGGVKYKEPGRLMLAKKAVIDPQGNAGSIEEVLYRFQTQRKSAYLPAWGQASFVSRDKNQNYLLKHATYSTCSPKDNAWQIEAKEIKLDHVAKKGVAKSAVLKIHDFPVLYSPYLSFPTSKERKSGFLMPQYGYTNISGWDFTAPYYLNLAPNYDATIIPHYYSLRGLMLGGEYRFLTPHSSGMTQAHILPKDHAFRQFLNDNRLAYPSLRGDSDNRWSILLRETTHFNENMGMKIDFQQVSDDYYLQDFSTNLASVTQNQLPRQGDLFFSSEHWYLSGMLQSYQTLHPINQSVISDVYERLPQLRARGSYSELPMNAQFDVLGQLDVFHRPDQIDLRAQGPRYHFNPVLAVPFEKPWGYFTPELQVVENYYDLNYQGPVQNRVFNRTIPRYGAEGGLFFERDIHVLNHHFTQTLEPKIFYLFVPYHDQTPIQVFDSGYMIFNVNQLFRRNRFSGFDRIGDTNQLTYALKSRWLSEYSGQEVASLMIGQVRYFSNRQVQLCHRLDGTCQDDPLTLGYLSPTSKYSPIASRFLMQLNPAWILSSEYVWNPATRATNNGNLNFHYLPAEDRQVNFGYQYLVNGDRTIVAGAGTENNAMHQISASYAWPFNDRWSSLGAYGYNISKRYNMMAFWGLQYDSCCWAFRLLGGRTFRSLTPGSFKPEYTNNVFLQVLLKGLGSASTSDPSSVIRTYLPGYRDSF